jgi:hypothetical protein
MNFGYLYEEDGIYLTTMRNRMMSTSWDDVEFEYICEDLTCNHKGENCSAKLVDHGDDSASMEFYVKYQDKLIIFDSYAEDQESENGENDEEFCMDFRYKTDVYEANLDGTNRVKKLEFDGSIAVADAGKTVALIDNKLFFGGPLREYIETPINIDGTNGDPITAYDAAIYEVDLDDYTCKTYAEFFNDPDASWNFRMNIFDGEIYVCIDNSEEDKAVWYQINPKTDESKLIKEFSTGIPRLDGVMDDTIYYHYEDGGLILYTESIKDENSDTKEFLSLEGTTLDEKGYGLTAFILDDSIVVRTAASAEEGEDFSEFTWYDTNGEAIQTIKYDKDITGVTAVGDRLIYMTPYEEQEEWWCNKDNFDKLAENSTYIGSILGEEHDTIDAETN